MRTSSAALVAPFTRRLLDVDLPGLDVAQRDDVTAFTVQRVDHLPSVLRVGVFCIAVPMRAVVALPGGGRVIRFLIDRPLPLLGEYVRMVRSLVYTYVWEHWPDTATDGSAATEQAITGESVPA